MAGSCVLGIDFENRLEFPMDFRGRAHLGLAALDVGSAREHDNKREPSSHIVRVAFDGRASMGFGPFEDLLLSILVIGCPGLLDEHPYGVGHAVDHPCGALIWTDRDRFLSTDWGRFASTDRDRFLSRDGAPEGDQQ